jgi:hypothetical protein
VRRTGRFLYEAYIETNGVDIKAYTLGERYCRAEQRAAPTLGVAVARDAITNKQMRQPTELTGNVAMRVTLVQTFQATVDRRRKTIRQCNRANIRTAMLRIRFITRCDIWSGV